MFAHCCDVPNVSVPTALGIADKGPEWGSLAAVAILLCVTLAGPILHLLLGSQPRRGPAGCSTSLSVEVHWIPPSAGSN